MKTPLALASLVLAILVENAVGQTAEANLPVSPIPAVFSQPSEIRQPPVDCGPGVLQEDVVVAAPRMWMEVDFLQWWLKAVCLKPPVLNSGSPLDAAPGATGQPGTKPIIDEGSHKFQFKSASGIRPSLTIALTEDRAFLFEADGFLLERVVARQAFISGDGSPATYIPYTSPQNVASAIPFTVPGVINGASIAEGSTQLWGAESNFSYAFSAPRGWFVLTNSVLVGFRYLDLRDQVLVTNRLGLVGQPDLYAVGSDNFTTHNQFYGPQVGLKTGIGHGPISADMQLKLGAGITHQTIDITGSPLISSDVPGLMPGPLLAQPSNIGQRTANRVSLVPEIALKVRYEVTSYAAVSLGYNLLYWNKVLCPGDQMDPHVNITQLPGRGPVVGPLVPAPIIVHTDAFAQGLTGGLEFRF
jgi:hypothetical protein